MVVMMGEVSLETSPKNIMIQDMINSEVVVVAVVVVVYLLTNMTT